MVLQIGQYLQTCKEACKSFLALAHHCMWQRPTVMNLNQIPWTLTTKLDGRLVILVAHSTENMFNGVLPIYHKMSFLSGKRQNGYGKLVCRRP